MLPKQLVYRKNMQLLEKVYGPANETVVVHCTNILEEKMGKDQRMYFLPKKSSTSQALSFQLFYQLIHVYLYLL